MGKKPKAKPSSLFRTQGAPALISISALGGRQPARPPPQRRARAHQAEQPPSCRPRRAEPVLGLGGDLQRAGHGSPEPWQIAVLRGSRYEPSWESRERLRQLPGPPRGAAEQSCAWPQHHKTPSLRAGGAWLWAGGAAPLTTTPPSTLHTAPRPGTPRGPLPTKLSPGTRALRPTGPGAPRSCPQLQALLPASSQAADLFSPTCPC